MAASKKTSKKNESGLPDPEELSFEAAVEELETIVERIEQGEIGLEEALVQRKRGDALIKRCRSILDTAEQELKHADIESAATERPAEEPGDD